MKVMNLMFLLEKMNPEADVYYDLGRDLDPIDIVTHLGDTVLLNSKRDA